MQLNAKQQAKLVAKVKEKWPNAKPCEMCQGTEWDVVDRILELKEFGGGGFPQGNQVIPVVALACTECGHFRLISAIGCGIIDQNGRVVDE